MMHSEGKNYYKIRMLVGKLFSFRTAEEWFKVFDKYIQDKPSDYITIAAGRKKYKGEIYPIHTFYPLKLVPFEDRQIYVVNDADAYMSHMYGDYMKIPDVENREKHLCVKLDFNN